MEWLLLLKLAVRNVFRNPRRTFLTVLLIGSGLAVLILYNGLVIGMNDAFIVNATHTFLGDAQIHREGFRKEQEVDLTIADWGDLKARLDQDPSVAFFSPRVLATGMISSPRNLAGVAIYGIDSLREAQVSKLKQAIRQGEYLDEGSRPPETQILIGTRLARLIEAGLGDRVVLTTAPAGGGEISQELFRVSGIFHFGVRQMDQSMVFIPLSRAQKLLRLDSRVHEVALRLKKLDDAVNPSLPLWKTASTGGNEALGWDRLLPQLKAILDMSEYGTLITAVILVGIISLGVINSLLMSIYERIFEFGVLKAIGTRPRAIAAMVLFESLTLAVLSDIAGMILGAGVSGYFSRAGFDFAGIEYGGLTLSEPIRTVLTADQFIRFPLFVLLLTLLAGIYPAVHAARLVPSEAMRKSL